MTWTASDLLVESFPLRDELVRKMPHRASVLDFGCGSGMQCAAMAKHGYQVTGCDVRITQECRELAEKSNFTVFEIGPKEVSPFDLQVDTGYSWHVLEHLCDPVMWLNTYVGSYIKPHGHLFIGVPRSRPDVAVSGHLTAGWGIAQLAYILAVAGYDCRGGSFMLTPTSVLAHVRRPEELTYRPQGSGWGNVQHLLPEVLAGYKDGVCYPGPEINWASPMKSAREAAY
jgi:2-polyprenyl-3-methyl-5-hydroxy-6-metoxy-1,4-benzoquinol methylase